MPIVKNREIPDDLVRKLREANQNLVIASLRAQDLQDQAEASVQRQTEFLSMLAHELRNPLAPIAMASDMLEKITSAHPQLPHIQQIINRQVTHMKRLLEDLLDASRISSGKITLQKAPLLLADMVHDAVELSEPSLTKHHQQLVIDLPPQPVVLNGDAVRLSQVFSNLLLNASKYSAPNKSIALSARPLANGTVAISVKDEGIGIAADMQPFIFDLFTQVPRTLDRSEGGLGIGLSMVRTLVEMHGGAVQVRSKGLNRGSEFIVVLPVPTEVLALDTAPALPMQAARSCRILIVEDNVDANQTLNFCLTHEGHCVASAYSGPDGLAMVQKGGYDMVISDIGLPGMNGYELLRQVRLLGLVPAPYCIAMTGYDQPSVRAHADEAGFDSYLVKPVSMETLQEVISKAFPAETPA
jgi:CheY-like chemotaxis protein